MPTVHNKRFIQTPVDNFILAKLEAAHLAPSPTANKRTLIRRATFDLIGLPPTPEEVAAFIADKSPDAFARVVDRLLASPRYGERWGRHWLDVARYADTKGYVFEEDRHYPYSYTYRDYVIRAFNEDLPYDEFIKEQIAADMMTNNPDKHTLAALGYLTLGRRFVNNIHDIIDDRIDVVCRGTMGLTVACARCHDHKYDPIPTKDYYGLYGVFDSSMEPAEEPLLGLDAPEKPTRSIWSNTTNASQRAIITVTNMKKRWPPKYATTPVNTFWQRGKPARRSIILTWTTLRTRTNCIRKSCIGGLTISKRGVKIRIRFRAVVRVCDLPEKNFYCQRRKELSARFAANADTYC